MDFTLEKWRTNFLEDFMLATKDPHLADNMCETLPYPMETAFAAEYIRERMFNSEERQMCRAIVCNDKAVGGVDVILGSGVFEKSGELSIWLAKEYRGKGLGAAVISEICSRCFEQYDIIRIEAHPYSVHPQAAAALIRAGFTHEGTMHSAIFKNGKTYDYEVFALIRH